MKNTVKAVCMAVAICWLLASRTTAQKAGLVVQSGHASAINMIVFSPDGKLLASGSSDASIKLWEVSTGQVLRTLVGQNPKISSIVFSPDGRMLASVSSDKTISLWDVATGHMLHRLAGHSGSIACLAFSNDSHSLASGDGDFAIKLWDVASGGEIRTLRPGSRATRLVAFSPGGPSGMALTSVSSDGQITLWDTATGSELRTLSVSLSEAAPIAISADGKMLASSYKEIRNPARNTIKVWDAISGRELHMFSGHTDLVTSAVFHSQMLVSSSWDKTIRFWDIATGRQLRRFLGGGKHLAISADGKIMATADGGGAMLRETARGGALRVLTVSPARITKLVLHPDGHTILSSDSTGLVKLWDVATGSVSRMTLGYRIGSETKVVTADGKVLLGAIDDKRFRLWDPFANRETYSVQLNSNAKLSVEPGPDGKTIAVRADSSAIRLLDLATGRELLTFSGSGGSSGPMTFSQDGKILAVTSAEQRVVLWDTSTGQVLRTLSQPLSGAAKAIFSPNGRILAIDGAGPTINLWEISTGRELSQLTSGKDQSALAFSPNGRVLVTRSIYLSGLRLWDVQTGRELSALIGHVGEVFSLGFLRDGWILVTGGQDGTIRFWEAINGRLIATLYMLGPDDWAVVDPEGRFDASPGAMKYLHYVVGLTTITLEQMKESYYEPGLISKLLEYNKQSVRDVPSLANVRLDLFPEINAEIDNVNSRLNLKLTNQGGGIGRVQVFVNDKEFMTDARNGQQVDSKAKQASVTVNLANAPNRKPGAENKVRVTAWNTSDRGEYLRSHYTELIWMAPGEGEKGPPSLYAVIGGVSTYSGDPQKMNLNYPAIDARDFARILKLGAARMFGADRVRISLLVSGASKSSATPAASDVKEIPPTKSNFKLAFEEVAAQAKQQDIVVIFLAGHGISYANSETNKSEYGYLTQEASALEKSAFASPLARQQQLITGGELAEWNNKIAANKTVIILDTCEAGSATQALLALLKERDLSSDQIRALERLKDLTGLHVLMGAATNKVSYETSTYGHGLLTQALMEGYAGPGLKEEKFVEVGALFRYAQQRVEDLAKGFSEQRPYYLGAENNFEIGLLEKADREQVKPASAKPFIISPQLINPAARFDDLDLNRALRRALKEAELNREINAVFLADEDLPNALRPSGAYQITRDKVKAQMVLIRDGKIVGETVVEGVKSDLDGLVKRLVKAIGTEIDKLLTQ